MPAIIIRGQASGPAAPVAIGDSGQLGAMTTRRRQFYSESPVLLGVASFTRSRQFYSESPCLLGVAICGSATPDKSEPCPQICDSEVSRVVRAGLRVVRRSQSRSHATRPRDLSLFRDGGALDSELSASGDPANGDSESPWLRVVRSRLGVADGDRNATFRSFQMQTNLSQIIV
jgi:hypothetical protein